MAIGLQAGIRCFPMSSHWGSQPNTRTPLASQMTIEETIRLAVSFVAGCASVTGTYIAHRQFKRVQGRIEIVRANGDLRVPDDWHDDGFFFGYHIALLNRGNTEYGISEIALLPLSRKFQRRVRRSKSLRYLSNQWQQLTFEDTLHQTGGRYSTLLLS